MSESNIAFLFPGQGSQKVGMLAAAYEQYEAVRDTFAEAAEALGYDMWDLIQNGEQDALNLTETTQPVLLTSSIALWRAWQAEGGARPALMAGHSLGEFSALVAAGSLGFADAVRLVRQRGQFMQTAVPVGEGAMAAIIGVDDAVINDACAAVDGVVAAVNFNSPGQVVIAGHTAAVDAAIAKLKEAGAKRAMPLPVSAPFHTELMKPAGERLAEVLAEITIAAPEVPVVHNVHAQTESDPEKIRALLVEQIYSPVQWTRCVQTMVDAGVERVVECGPGKVLSGLNRRIDKSLTSFSLEEPDSLASTLAELA
ncbi:[acyl-carrier-protein] S-malonyltransferase [Halioglobus japonicus]|uniref:Malonyl CoA-acyl carrier protein transacylase n=1 Tax=Halioglobus japonicus TaxID=930805 RepID=A0AAP8SPX3_9GAMM|nr:ACP S-malonyltransferase [Halioglobus japonicus]AQA19022.1 [acyl-carrier-protein] S-malonyltransferase [Halioglobus japonicus]PLW87959.1 [acyl-carrier-protein] S-malonyltransferase [Halioglobus japonicus]GHD20260.1 malonyl CoA-acyl carrier protein transacylase [Halioglobus japonicus]